MIFSAGSFKTAQRAEIGDNGDLLQRG